MGVSDQLHALAASQLRKSPPIPTGWEVEEVQVPVFTLWNREIFLAAARNRTPSNPLSVTIPAPLKYRQCFPIVFRKCSVRIPAGAQAVMTEPGMGPDNISTRQSPFPSKSFPTNNSSDSSVSLIVDLVIPCCCERRELNQKRRHS
jgi:hypothetical protein